MVSTSAAYAPYADARRVNLSISFGVVAPEAAALAVVSASDQSEVSRESEVLDDVEAMGGKYTSLEHNMWVLDGSYTTYSDTGEHGMQLDEISGDDKTLAGSWIEFVFSEPQTSYGFTLIFDDKVSDDYPTEVITTTYDSGGDEIESLTTYPDGWRHVFSMPSDNYSAVRFEFVKTNVPHRRVRLCEVKFGTSYYYDAASITKCTVKQSASPWCESLASAEVEATVDNSDHLYNMINPAGLYNYLQDGQYMRWAIEIGGETIDMGRAYFTEADSDDGGLTATITFNDRLYVLDDIEYNRGRSGTWTLKEAVNTLLEASGTGITATFNNHAAIPIRMCIPTGTSIREALRLCAQAAMCTCYMGRDNTLHFYSPVIGDAAQDALTRDTQHEDAQITVGKQYNIVELTAEDAFAEDDAKESVYTAGTVESGDFERVYSVSNPLVAESMGAMVAQWLLYWIQRRVSYEVTTRGNPALELLDTVQIEDVYGVDGNAVLTELNYEYDGGLECDITAIK